MSHISCASQLSKNGGHEECQISILMGEASLFQPGNNQALFNGDIQFMDKIIQSRINRSLVIHGLENLVFEKRQRKSIEPPPIPTPNKVQQPKINKKKEIPNKKQINQSKSIEKNQKQSKQPSQRNLSNKQDSSTKKKEIKKKAKIQESDSIIDQESLIIKPKPSTKKQRSKQDKPNQNIPISAQKEISQLGINEQDKTLNRRGRGRPKKQAYKQISSIQEKPVVLQQKEIPPPIQVQVPIPLFRIPSQQPIKSLMSIQQPQLPKEEQQNKANGRQRKAKMNPYKSYNQNEGNNFSDQSEIEQRQCKKKKKISKIYRNKANNKPYNLNRIFRKEAKRHFQTFTLNCNLNQVSLPYFVQQFGVFDLIHFSLPISYLNQLPEISTTIEKGFVFLWAQQGQTQIGYHLLNRWGFDVIDQIVWIKSNEDEHRIEADNVDICNSIDTDDNQKMRPLFINCKSTCLVGYKCPLGNKAQYRTKVSNNIIFARGLDGVKKPAQIYEIADLMMPGAKKLQFGGQAQKGWLNLNHHQNSLVRCNICLRQQKLFILPHLKQKYVQCKRCIVNRLKEEAQSEQIEYINKLYKEQAKIKIQNVVYTRQQVVCSCCKIVSEQGQSLGLILCGEEQTLCYPCYKMLPNKDVADGIDVLIAKKNMYLKSQLSCSQCGVITICDVYFECSKCKNHITCKNCFWKDKAQNDTINQVQSEGKKVLKKQVLHEWRLKFIKNYPQMKFSCFGCKVEVSIPFWCCQTCQNWFWCGKCNKGSSEIHPHYQNSKHIEYIMI